MRAELKRAQQPDIGCRAAQHDRLRDCKRHLQLVTQLSRQVRVQSVKADKELGLEAGRLDVAGLGASRLPQPAAAFPEERVQGVLGVLSFQHRQATLTPLLPSAADHERVLLHFVDVTAQGWPWLGREEEVGVLGAPELPSLRTER